MSVKTKVTVPVGAAPMLIMFEFCALASIFHGVMEMVECLLPADMAYLP